MDFAQPSSMKMKLIFSVPPPLLLLLLLFCVPVAFAQVIAKNDLFQIEGQNNWCQRNAQLTIRIKEGQERFFNETRLREFVGTSAQLLPMLCGALESVKSDVVSSAGVKAKVRFARQDGWRPEIVWPKSASTTTPAPILTPSTPPVTPAEPQQKSPQAPSTRVTSPAQPQSKPMVWWTILTTIVIAASGLFWVIRINKRQQRNLATETAQGSDKKNDKSGGKNSRHEMSEEQPFSPPPPPPSPPPSQAPENRNLLPSGTRLNEYEIQTVLGEGGFGIVYKARFKARHAFLDEDVAIKEYLPREIAIRDGQGILPISRDDAEIFTDGLKRFLQEAKQLTLFRGHPNVIRCRDFFEANGTAYLVMDYEDGLAFDRILKLKEQNNKPVNEAELLNILVPVLNGLKAVHDQGVLHRDIKPGNIFVRRADEQPLLLDFGAAKQNYAEHTKSQSAFTPGYAPMEQIADEGELGPWTDIYAIGALIWRVIAGRNPPEASKRDYLISRGKGDPMEPAHELPRASEFSGKLLTIVNKCLEPVEENRYQKVDDLLDDLLDNTVR